jgi:hypothetical protein
MSGNVRTRSVASSRSISGETAPARVEAFVVPNELHRLCPAFIEMPTGE